MLKQFPLAILLDRDGVINFDSPDYILKPEQWIPIPGSLQAIARLHARKIPVAIVSNQSALGRGMIDHVTFDAIHTRMMTAIEQAGGNIAHTAYCPHTPEDHCDCRKPGPGLVLESLKVLGLQDQAPSVMLIGDSIRDIQAAINAHVKPVLVQTGYGNATETLHQARKLDPGIRMYPALSYAIDHLLGRVPC